ncbi:hypothetical protein [Rhodococcus jostii]|uniref:Uncharacterized protein n=1 Tax=Rhodococcus jostii TaxID=132919 RepID=A0A1H4IY02_RHOJO|nr:hypothetical protein [Rhodococcus jostii]SEB38964.1 hypothetical protein SAMN04490220_0648 [Rhodococcus jostii]
MRAVLTVAGDLGTTLRCVLPGAGPDYTERNAFIRVTIGGVLLLCVLVWQIRRIIRAAVPELRAIEALVAVISLHLVLFATTYLSLSLTTPASFNQHLDHTRALY